MLILEQISETFATSQVPQNARVPGCPGEWAFTGAIAMRRKLSSEELALQMPSGLVPKAIFDDSEVVLR